LADGEPLRITLVDVPHVVSEFESELGLGRGTLDGQLEDDPDEVKARQDAAVRLQERIGEHSRQWEAMSGDPLHHAHAVKRLEVLERLAGRDRFYVKFTCPACANSAALQCEVDFDDVDGETMPQGVFPVHLECTFCNLLVNDSYELDELKASDFLYEREMDLRGEC
jgi:hypothetical protein